ncbi:MAG: SMI1/KNR4 family protein [Candidatus Thiodiazotropha endolucinida]
MNINEVIDAVEMVYGSFREDIRISETRLEGCERRLGVKLPDSVRTLYLRTGGHGFHHACDSLIAPEELKFDGEFLVFYRQDQGSLSWGINRNEFSIDDPQVWAIYDDEVLSDSPTVSGFLAFEAAWQAINGGALPCYGILDEYKQEPVEFSPAYFENEGILISETRHGEVRYKAGVILLHCSEGEGFLGLATTTESAFHETAKELRVAIDDWTINSFLP